MAQTTGGLSHEALLYRSEEELGEVVVEFVQTGGAAGEPTLVALPRANADLVANALAGYSGSLCFRDMSDLGGNPSRLLGAYDDWIAEHDRPVRVVGELIWPERSWAETVECLRQEALLNHALASAKASILCPYDARRLAAEVLESAELTHPSVIADGVRRPSHGYGDPVEVHAAGRWPQTQAAGPVSEHAFAGDLRSLRRAIAEDPIAGTLTPDRMTDLVFVVNEAATNAVKHGDGTCVTRLWRDGETVVSEVHTESSIGDPLAGCRRPGLQSPGGRGLWMINQLCDLVELRSDLAGTTLRMHLRPHRGAAFDGATAG